MTSAAWSPARARAAIVSAIQRLRRERDEARSEVETLRGAVAHERGARRRYGSMQSSDAIAHGLLNFYGDQHVAAQAALDAIDVGPAGRDPRVDE